MQKFYIVPKDTQTHKQYMEYKRYTDQLCDLFTQFAEKYNIETHRFYPYVDKLYIESTDNDNERFATQFRKDCKGQFKKTSETSIEWIKTCKDSGIEKVQRPSVFIPFMFNATGHCHHRLFDVNETVYCTFESDTPFKAPDEFQEIRASKFYSLMEENNIEL